MGFARISSRTDALGSTTEFEYDGDGNLAIVKDADGGIQRYEYDYFGRPTKETDSLGLSSTTSYDVDGRLIRRTDRNGRAQTFGYDVAGRLETRSDHLGNVSAVAYDGAGRPRLLSNTSSRLQFSYDRLDRVTNATSDGPNSGQPTVSFDYEYDAVGNRTRVVHGSRSTEYTYDRLNRLTAATEPAGGVFSLTRDGVGRVQQLTRPNGVKTNYTWDAADQIKDIVHQSGAITIERAHYEYDSAGRRTQFTDNSGAHQYTYDAASQLIAADHPGSQPDESYSYDSRGNRVSGGHGGQIHDSASRLLRDNSFDYAYDAEGNLTSKTERPLGLVTRFETNGDGRLSQVSLPDGRVEHYRYDALGRRIETGLGADITRSAYGVEKDRQADFDGANVETASYVFGGGIDTPLSVRRGGASKYFHQNSIGSVQALSSASGASAEAHQYSAFGESVAAGAGESPFGFAGRELDKATGLVYMRNRYYNPDTGKFISEDRLPSTNGSRYALNSPTSMVDPLGDTTEAELSSADATSNSLHRISLPSMGRYIPALNGMVSAGQQALRCGVSKKTFAAGALGWGAGMVGAGGWLRLMPGLKSLSAGQAAFVAGMLSNGISSIGSQGLEGDFDKDRLLEDIIVGSIGVAVGSGAIAESFEATGAVSSGVAFFSFGSEAAISSSIPTSYDEGC